MGNPQAKACTFEMNKIKKKGTPTNYPFEKIIRIILINN